MLARGMRIEVRLEGATAMVVSGAIQHGFVTESSNTTGDLSDRVYFRSGRRGVRLANKSPVSSSLAPISIALILLSELVLPC